MSSRALRPLSLLDVFLVHFPCGEIFLSLNLMREAEKEHKHIYEDLPLFQIEQEFGKTDGGRLGSSRVHPILQCAGLILSD